MQSAVDLALGPLRAERPKPGRHFVEHAAEGVDVGSDIEDPPRELLRRHIGEAAPLDGALMAAIASREAEVRYLESPAGFDEDIGWLDVGVDEVELLVRRHFSRMDHARAELPREIEGGLHGHAAGGDVARELQAAALVAADELEDDVGPKADILDGDGLHDVRMCSEADPDGRLLGKAPHDPGVEEEPVLEGLEHQLALARAVVADEDGAHAAPEDTLYLVAIVDELTRPPFFRHACGPA